MSNTLRPSQVKNESQNLSTNEVELTDVELAAIHGAGEKDGGHGGHGGHGGWHHGRHGRWRHHGGWGWGGPAYGGPMYGGPIYGGPMYGGPMYGGPIYGGPALCGGGCPSQPPVIVVQQPATS